MKRIRINLLVLVLGVISILGGGFTVNAEDTSTPTKITPFGVKIGTSPYQTKDIGSYFDLNVSSGQQVDLELQVTNTSKDPIDITVNSGNAFTSPLGGIAYVARKDTAYSSITDSDYEMMDRIKVPKSIHLQGKETKKIPIRVTSPERAVGTYLGAVILSMKDGTTKVQGQSDKNVDLSIDTRLEFVIPIKLNMSKVEEEPLIVNDTKISVDPSGVSIVVGIENPNAKIMEGVSYKYTVRDKKGKLVFKGEVLPFKVAPKSRVFFFIPWQGELKDGEYFIDLVPSYATENISKPFKVSRQAIKDYSKFTSAAKPLTLAYAMSYTFWTIVILIVVVALYSSYKMGQVRGVRKRGKEKEEKEINNESR